eukprot:SAG22_NODE_1970_length_3231_cov_4.101533_3_plen_76_part_00
MMLIYYPRVSTVVFSFFCRRQALGADIFVLGADYSLDCHSGIYIGHKRAAVVMVATILVSRGTNQILDFGPPLAV